MALTANPENIQNFGTTIKGIPAAEPALTPPPTLGADGPLSAGLASAQSMKQLAVGQFVQAKDAGITAAGDALIQIGANLQDFDRKGAAGIQQVLPAAAKQPTVAPRPTR